MSSYFLDRNNFAIKNSKKISNVINIFNVCQLLTNKHTLGNCCKASALKYIV